MTEDVTYLARLLLDPKETLSVELKNWMNPKEAENRSKLAKELLALANHGGGYLIFGFDDKTHLVSEPIPSSLQDYSSDTINSIVKRYADPAFNCTAHIVEHPVTKQAFPIVSVPGGHRVPIRCKSGSQLESVNEGAYYMRLTGPESGVARNSKDWDDLLKRCLFNNKEDLLDNIRSIISGQTHQLPNENNLDQSMKDWLSDCDTACQNFFSQKKVEFATYYEYGFWSIAYKLLGVVEPVRLEVLNNIMLSSPGTNLYPSWDMGKDAGAFKNCDTDDTLEWLVYADYPHWQKAWTSYSRARTDLFFFLRGSYVEDIEARDGRPGPAQTFYTANGVEFVHRTIQHAINAARVLKRSDLDISIEIVWNKTKSRRLFSPWNAPDAGLLEPYLHHRYTTNRDKITLNIGPIALSNFESNFTETTSDVIEKIFRAFNFEMDKQKLNEYIAQFTAKARQS